MILVNIIFCILELIKYITSKVTSKVTFSCKWMSFLE